MASLIALTLLAAGASPLLSRFDGKRLIEEPIPDEIASAAQAVFGQPVTVAAVGSISVQGSNLVGAVALQTESLPAEIAEAVDVTHTLFSKPIGPIGAALAKMAIGSNGISETLSASLSVVEEPAPVAAEPAASPEAAQ